MKRIARLMLLAMVASLFAVGCAPAVQTVTTRNLRFPVQDLGMDVYHTGIYQRPMLVDLVIADTIVTGRASDTIPNEASLQVLTLIRERVERMAIKNAVEAAGADLLVRPIYTYSQSGNTITVEVKGYPARYRNFRPIGVNDPEWDLHFKVEDSVR
jgi:hypothetical protein